MNRNDSIAARPAMRSRLHRPLYFLLGLALVGGELRAAESPTNAVTLFTNAQQMAELLTTLGTNVPANRYEARFQAVVIYVSPPTRRLYVQQGDLGVQVTLTVSVRAFRVGNLVEVSGTVLGGRPHLQIGNAQATVVGDAPLPEPKLVSAHRLVRGDDAYRYVALRGIVRDMVSSRNGMNLLLTDHAYPFDVTVQASPEALPQEWMDAEIEVLGFSYPFYTDGRTTSFRFNAMSTNDVRVLSAGLSNRFEGRPLLTIAEAARLPQEWVNRVRIAGTVTVHRPRGVLFLDDGTGAMLVEPLRRLAIPAGGQHLDHEPQLWLQPGDRVEVIGVRRNWYALTPTLICAEYRRVGTAPAVQPVKVSLRDLREGRQAGRLVTVTAQLIDQRGWATATLMNYQQLVFRIDNEIFNARWESKQLAKWDLKTDQYYEVTGVNDAERSGKRNTFELFLRSPADLVAVAAPPFWVRAEFQRLAMAGGGVALLAGGWIFLLRGQMRRLERRVAQRTADLSGANEQLQREVVQRRTAEESLRASEARKAAVLETALDSIITIDRHGCVLDFNPAAEKTFGYTREEVVGREMAELIIPEPFRHRHREGLKRAVETGADAMIGRRIELTALRRSGEEFAVDLALARINTKDGPIFTAHIQDISERKRAETERERALAHEKELSELKSRFVSMVSHEFRTPLGIITSSADILDAYLERLTPEERQSNIRDITDATRQMSRMMEEVLLLGRVEAGKMTCRPAPLDLAMFCQRLVDEVTSATSSRCPIHLATTPGMPEAMADESLLRHIFTNLINNAIKYSPIASPVEFRVEARDHLAVFTVSDRGIGIPAEDAHLLFQAFHRGRNVGDRPGTGLGMTVVKRCVELHGGKIAFESTEGRGTTLVVALPLFGAGPSPNGDGTTTFIRAAARGRNLTFVS